MIDILKKRSYAKGILTNKTTRTPSYYLVSYRWIMGCYNRQLGFCAFKKRVQLFPVYDKNLQAHNLKHFLHLCKHSIVRHSSECMLLSSKRVAQEQLKWVLEQDRQRKCWEPTKVNMKAILRKYYIVVCNHSLWWNIVKYCLS